MAKTVMCNIICLSLISAVLLTAVVQQMDVNVTSTGICKGARFKNIYELKQYLNGCVVIVGSLEISIEQARAKDFNNTEFYNLREITEYLIIYRVRGLESIGQLFPNLTRIRGNRLLNNFALIVYDNQDLIEIGLYSLLKIDRGGVILWDLPHACFVETIDWQVLAPRARRVISPPDGQIECNIPCTCSVYRETNRCWNNRKCQLFTEGVEAEICKDQCLGCRKTKKHLCFTCRHYTYNFTCVPKCPLNTIILPDNNYCITQEICHNLGRLVWNNTCLSKCPMDFKMNNKTGIPTCEPCIHCEMTCSSLLIQSLSSIQSAERCVYINGSLTIQHLRAIPDHAMKDLKLYLGNIQEVSEYILVETSDVITSLDFLASLRVVKGKSLKDGRYSLYVNENQNLQTLFSPKVTNNLIVENGSVLFKHNPVLCMNVINEIKDRFPISPIEFDITLGSNGYRGGCREVQFNFTIKTTSVTSVEIKFPIENFNIHYTALYVRLPPGVESTVVPESCSECEWHDAHVPTIKGQNISIIELKSLVRASTYAFCVEVYDPEKNILSRSNIDKFTTPIGIPQPPFIVELVASKPNAVVIRWVDHKDYVKHIEYYALDVAYIENIPRKSSLDYCKLKDTFFETDEFHHVFLRRPPPEYSRGCESMCGILSSVTPGAMAEDFFSVCDDGYYDCNNAQESINANNLTLGGYVRTLHLNIRNKTVQVDLSNNPQVGSSKYFQIGGLAPFSDYKFSLRACADGQCSRSERAIVRTLSSDKADIPSLISVEVNSKGMVSLKWQPPEVSNGPILTYLVEILPAVKINNLLPQVWCMPAHKTETVVKSVVAPKYLVRVCAKTLATFDDSSRRTRRPCCNWKNVVTTRPHITAKIDLLWTGVLCGMLIYIASLVFGWFKNKRIIRSDETPLVDNSASHCIESDSLALM